MKETTNKKSPQMPELLTVSPSPHIKAPVTTRGIMVDVIIALSPAFIWGVYMAGIRALLITAVSILSCVLFEFLCQLILRRKVTVSDCSAALTGMLLAMNLPVTVSLWIPIVGAFFAIVVVKQVFGGIGKNIVNPALAARVFLFTAWASQMTRYASPAAPVSSFAFSLSEADVVAGATPLASLKAEVIPSATLADMFIGNTGGSIGEASALLLLIGGIYLLVRRVITWHIPVSFLGTVAIITYLFPRVGVAHECMLYELMAGGLVLGAFFMATDYATSPLTATGKLLYGIGCGGITVLIRYFGSYPEGVSFAILIMNLLVWYLDLAGMPKRFGGVKKA